MPWVGLQFVIVIFLDHTHLLSKGFSFCVLESKQIDADSALLLNISLSVSRKWINHSRFTLVINLL